MKTPMRKATVLVVDDDEAVLDTLKDILSDDFNVITVNSGQAAIDAAKDNENIASVVMDIKMARMDGITAARGVKAILPEVPIIFHTGYPGEYDEREIDESEKPFDYIRKGKSLPELVRTVRNAVESYELKRDSKMLSQLMQRDFGIVGRSRPMQQLFRAIRDIGPTSSKVMILGETGTGKELVARAIHSISGRDPLAVLNCNHKDPGHIESELFGHTKEAFSSAGDRTGKVEYANGGTLFLDEIGDLDITTQAKLLRVVDRGEYEKLGDPKLRKTDLRVVCATHRDLEQSVRDAEFREDLYFRLRGKPIATPPLRERKEDIPLLVNAFLQKFTVDRGWWPKYFDDDAIDVLLEYDWPGNVRQLSDAVESLVNSTDSEMIFSDDVRSHLGQRTEAPTMGTRSLGERLKEYERTLILEALHRTGFNIKAAAELLEADRSNLQKKIKAFGIDTSSYRS